MNSVPDIESTGFFETELSIVKFQLWNMVRPCESVVDTLTQNAPSMIFAKTWVTVLELEPLYTTLPLFITMLQFRVEVVPEPLGGLMYIVAPLERR